MASVTILPAQINLTGPKAFQRLVAETQNGARMTGDVTQTDLPPGSRPGLKEAEELLSGIEGISCCRFSDADVVRHPLVQKIVVAYERSDRVRSEARERRGNSRRYEAAREGADADPEDPDEPRRS